MTHKDYLAILASMVRMEQQPKEVKHAAKHIGRKIMSVY